MIRILIPHPINGHAEDDLAGYNSWVLLYWVSGKAIFSHVDIDVYLAKH